jgi:tol-pal system protein YbgF
MPGKCVSRLMGIALAASLLGCAAYPARDGDPTAARLETLTREQERLSLRLDETARALIELKDRVAAVEASSRQTAREPAEPRLEVVRVEPAAKPAAEPAPPKVPVVQVLPPPAEPPAAAPAPTGKPPSAEPTTPAGEPSPASALYAKAFGEYRQGQYAKAILDFEEFLAANPVHDYADDAQYWIGEGYFSQGEYDQAIVEFTRVVERHPQGNRAADAYYMIAQSYEKLGQKDRAGAFYTRLMGQYPSSEAAQRAKRRLESP